ncbi:MAG TPA: MATE family efflux transporter, partial [Longimicrobiales bacterium]|nr:MATE family efflux transporter [Longimicrobiales bacterium]
GHATAAQASDAVQPPDGEQPSDDAQPSDGEQPSDATQPSDAGQPAPGGRRRFDRSIVEGPLVRAVWMIAWPTMLQNVISGLQGLVDHAMVGSYVGYTGNAAIGVSWQIYLVIVVFISSLFTGMSILVARFAGADDEEKVNRTIYQAFLTAMGLSLGVMAPLGYVLAPTLLELVNAAPEVQAEALPYLRIMFVFSFGTLLFFMLGGALRSAGDARTPLRLGVVLTVLNVALNVILIRGVGPIPAFGTAGAAMGTVIASGVVGIYALWRLWYGGWVVGFPRGGRLGPDWTVIRSLFRFGLPTGIQGIAMNVGGVLLLAFIGSLTLSAEAQAAYAVSYTQLFSFIIWTSIGLMGAAAAVAGQNLGAGNADRATEAVHAAARIGLVFAVAIGASFLLIPEQLLGIFGMQEPVVVELGTELLRFLSLSGLFVAVALTYTGGLQGTGDTKSPLYISILSQLVIPLGLCFIIQQLSTLDPWEIWLAILLGHISRAVLSVLRFRQGHWRSIVVEISG